MKVRPQDATADSVSLSIKVILEVDEKVQYLVELLREMKLMSSYDGSAKIQHVHRKK